jgi:cyclic pyranopterin phosphate synthase
MHPSAKPSDVPSLIDPFGRVVDYLRLSVTDRCNFRCVYCMDPDAHFAPRAEIMTLEELLRVSQTFTRLGIRKIRITGGEPLVRSNILWLLENISASPGLKELALTTNGFRLAKMAGELWAARVNRLNISLDTLNPELFRKITRSDHLPAVLRGIDAALDAGFSQVKINSVVIRDLNHREVTDLAAFAVGKGVDISFIEEMPVGIVEDHARDTSYYTCAEIRRDLSRHFELQPVDLNTGGPSRYHQVVGTATRIGFISPRSHDFCVSCNRVRVTVKGRLLLCLGQENSVDLRGPLRADSASNRLLEDAIRQGIAHKPLGHDFSASPQGIQLRQMNTTGG